MPYGKEGTSKCSHALCTFVSYIIFIYMQESLSDQLIRHNVADSTIENAINAEVVRIRTYLPSPDVTYDRSV